MKKRLLVNSLAALGGALVFALPHSALAAALPELIRVASTIDPAVLEAQARSEEAAMQLEKTRSEHWPVVSLQASSKKTWEAKHKYDEGGDDFVGLITRLNLYAGGAIQARIARDSERATLYEQKERETREQIAWQIAQYYLQALAASEMLAVERENLERHQKIIADLKSIVEQDKGRYSELVQAEGRALQVSMRIDEYQKIMRLAESRLSRFHNASESVELRNPFADTDWQVWMDAVASENGAHPSLLAQQAEARAVRQDLKNIRASTLFPRLDLEVGIGNEQNAQVVMNWDAFNRGATYSRRGAARQLAAAESRSEWLQREIDERNRTAIEDMARSKQQITASARQIASAEEVARLYEMQFKAARRSLLDVLNAYSELANVRVAASRSHSDWRLAVASYLYANAGLERWALSVNPAGDFNAMQQALEDNAAGGLQTAADTAPAAEAAAQPAADSAE